MLNHGSSLLMKRQVPNCFLKQGRLDPSLHPKLSMGPRNLPASLHGLCLMAPFQQVLQMLVGSSSIHRQKAGKALTCTGVFERRGKMKAQCSSAEDADKRSAYCFCSAVSAEIWGNHIHPKP